MNKKYIEPHTFSYEIVEEEIIATSLTSKADGLGYGGTSTCAAGDDVNADTKSRIDFPDDVDLPW